MTENKKTTKFEHLSVELKEDERQKGWFDLYVDGKLALYLYKSEGCVFMGIYREVIGHVHI